MRPGRGSGPGNGPAAREDGRMLSQAGLPIPRAQGPGNNLVVCVKAETRTEGAATILDYAVIDHVCKQLQN
jgi:hypothetical protein